MYFRFSAETFSRTSSHICGIYVVVINRFYDCEIAHPRVACKICSSFLSVRHYEISILQDITIVQ